MQPTHSPRRLRRPRPSVCTFAAALLLLMPLTGCLVAGYSSQSGLWIWPGSLVITLVLILLYFLMRHR